MYNYKGSDFRDREYAGEPVENYPLGPRPPKPEPKPDKKTLLEKWLKIKIFG